MTPFQGGETGTQNGAGVSSQRCEILLSASVPSPEPNMSYLTLHNNPYGEISLLPF